MEIGERPVCPQFWSVPSFSPVFRLFFGRIRIAREGGVQGVDDQILRLVMELLWVLIQVFRHNECEFAQARATRDTELGGAVSNLESVEHSGNVEETYVGMVVFLIGKLRLVGSDEPTVLAQPEACETRADGALAFGMY